MDQPSAQRPIRTLDQHLARVRAAPRDAGPVALIVLRPGTDEREVVTSAELTPEQGVVGDGWLARGSTSMPDGSANPEAQVTVMNTRVLAAIEPDPARWPLAGDQLYVDMDLSVANLPPGTRLAIGNAVVEVTARPHRGCVKFAGRFGNDALRWVNTPEGQALRMRGMHVKVVSGGRVCTGDVVRRLG